MSKEQFEAGLATRREVLGTDYVDRALAALAAGDSPDPASTKPYGCSVKY